MWVGSSTDPVAGLAPLPQTLNPYTYGVNNPLAYPEPSGEFPPALAVAAPIAGRMALAVGADYTLNAAVSSVHYMVTRPEDKPFVWSDFATTVGGEAFDATVADPRNPVYLLSPLHKADKISDVLRLTDEANDARRVVICKHPDQQRPGALRPGERTLDLPDLGNSKAN